MKATFKHLDDERIRLNREQGRLLHELICENPDVMIGRFTKSSVDRSPYITDSLYIEWSYAGGYIYKNTFSFFTKFNRTGHAMHFEIFSLMHDYHDRRNLIDVGMTYSVENLFKRLEKAYKNRV